MHKPRTVEQKLRGLLKDLENTPHSVGLVLLQERLVKIAEITLAAIEKNPRAFANPIFSLGMYVDLCNRIRRHLDTTVLPTGMELLDFGGGTVPGKVKRVEFFKRYPNIEPAQMERVVMEAEQLIAQP